MFLSNHRNDWFGARDVVFVTQSQGFGVSKLSSAISVPLSHRTLVVVNQPRRAMSIGSETNLLLEALCSYGAHSCHIKRGL